MYAAVFYGGSDGALGFLEMSAVVISALAVILAEFTVIMSQL